VRLLPCILGILLLLLLPAPRAISQGHQRAISRALPSVVRVTMADVINGQLVAMASGSGTVVTSNGHVLTNYHVLRDRKNARLHDVFVIERVLSAGQEPTPVCAGKAPAGVFRPDIDLALIRCDMTLSGRPMAPMNWPSVDRGDSAPIHPGQKLWVVGYPISGGSTFRITSGTVTGWADERGGPGGRTFMKTDASIGHGHSGGAAMNQRGHLIGIPSAYRRTQTIGESRLTTRKTGLIRPIEQASSLIAGARNGLEMDSPENAILVRSRVISAASGGPVANALIVALGPAVTNAQEFDPETMLQHAVSWGRSNARGEFILRSPIAPGTYALAVLRKGFHPLFQSDGLSIPSGTTGYWDPFHVLELTRK